MIESNHKKNPINRQDSPPEYSWAIGAEVFHEPLFGQESDGLLQFNMKRSSSRWC
jgi:hypothetical protein